MKQGECDAILRDALPQVDWSASERMAGDGLITSLDILLIITAVYKVRRIRIPANEMKACNFDTPRAICALCTKYEIGRG